MHAYQGTVAICANDGKCQNDKTITSCVASIIHKGQLKLDGALSVRVSCSQIIFSYNWASLT